MTEQERAIDQLHARLGTLERRLSAMRVMASLMALVGGAVLLASFMPVQDLRIEPRPLKAPLLLQHSPLVEADKVEASQFIVRDSEGRERGTFGANEKLVYFNMKNNDGGPGISIVLQDSDRSIDLANANGETRVRLYSYKDGSGLLIRDPAGRMVSQLPLESVSRVGGSDDKRDAPTAGPEDIEAVWQQIDYILRTLDKLAGGQ